MTTEAPTTYIDESQHELDAAEEVVERAG